MCKINHHRQTDKSERFRKSTASGNRTFLLSEDKSASCIWTSSGTVEMKRYLMQLPFHLISASLKHLSREITNDSIRKQN